LCSCASNNITQFNLERCCVLPMRWPSNDKNKEIT
jgi:hypothetical protein